MRAPASAVPPITGVGSVLDAEVVMAGAGGATLSTVMASGAEAAEVFPAASLARAVRLKLPLGRVELVMDQEPFGAAVVEPSWVLPLKRRTVLPASALPLMVGVASPVMLSVLEEPESLLARRSSEAGASGATLSFV